MKSMIQNFIVFFGINLLLLSGGISCYPRAWNPQQVKTQGNYNDYLHTERQFKLPELEKTFCTSDYYCNSSGCPQKTKTLNQLAESQYHWNHVLPEKSMLIAQQDGYILRFKWNSKELSNSKKFHIGQALLISMVTQSFEFSSIKTSGAPYKDYMSNLPCHYKAQKYAHVYEKDKFQYELKKVCGISESIARAYQLHKSKKLLEEYANEHENHFTIGSMCPEKIKANQWYFILLKLRPGFDTSTMAYIQSQVVEDTYKLRPQEIQNEPTPQSFTDCPYLIQSTILSYRNKKTVCGKNHRKIWLNRICIPTKSYVFTPGIDTQNTSRRKAFCYDNTYGKYEAGDGDGWFDTRAYTSDTAGNEIPITNNMLLHSTHIGDCHNSDPSQFHTTEKCGWFNIGQIKPGLQCYWNHKENTCYFEKEYKNKFYPEKFLQRYFEESTKDNNYAGSLDRIGRAMSWVKQINNGYIQYLNYGSQGYGVLTHYKKEPNSPARFVSYPFWDIYRLRFQHVYGKLGYAISEVIKTKSYYEQKFEFGWIRKYLKTKNEYLVKLSSNTPEKYFLNCQNKKCHHPTSICINNFCVNKKYVNNYLQKKCIDNSFCLISETCHQGICSPQNAKKN